MRSPSPAKIFTDRFLEAREPAERAFRLQVLATWETREAHRRAFVAGASLAANDGAGFTAERGAL